MVTLPEVLDLRLNFSQFHRTYKMSGIMAFVRSTSRSKLDQGRVGEDAQTTGSSAGGFTPPVELFPIPPDI